ncbi:hypothetical protein MNBD_NITROSPINAE04-1258 [hydrothermal vent metagenome]|uniref:Ferrous iron transporter FeoA-like domain-containing protein n=1 Tax=hydrothermal vent metagenome TaxID=652676 RepID=A0A3B1C024_9ZZZZ
MEHNKDHRKDELLEILWHLDESHDLTLSSLREHDAQTEFEKDLNEFSSSGILKFDGENITMTQMGLDLARGIIRRHRLAERLVADVLGKKPEETEQAACEFEHILAPELVESICVLLGHPRSCPHGSPIPEGECCKEIRKSVESLVVPLKEMKTGEVAKIASINTTNKKTMGKLLSLGFVPGASIKLLQKFPALALEANLTQIAIENSVGEAINIWRPTTR